VPTAGRVETAQDVEERGLAAGGGPEQHDQLAAIELEVDAAEGVDLALAHAIDLRQAVRAEDDAVLGWSGERAHLAPVRLIIASTLPGCRTA
jgi:hypothetical protein